MIFGAAKETITPCFKMKMAGFAAYSGSRYETIHDDLYAHALILEDDERNSALIIALDVLFHDFSLTEEIMHFAQEQCGIPKDHVLLNYSHTHNGPALKNYDAWEYSEEYDRYLVEALKRCVLRASSSRVEGNVSHASVEGDWNISRRLIVDGQCEFRPNPAGARDGSLQIFRFTDTQGEIRSLLFTFPCHPSSTGGGSRSISAEYTGRLCQLADTMRYGSTSLFLQGFGGDAKSRCAVSDAGDAFKAASFSDIDRMASSMFAAVNRALQADTFSPLQLRLAGKHFTIPLRIDAYPKEYFEKQYEEQKQKSGFIGNCARFIVEHYDDLEDQLDLHASVLTLSDDVFVFALGGEPSFNVGEILRNEFRGKKIVCIGYCDDIAYIPSDKLIREGGYEADGSIIEYRLKGKIAAGIDDALIRGFQEAMRSLDR